MDMIDRYAFVKAIKALRFKELSVRGLSKEAEIGVGTSKACLDYLYKNKLVKKNIIGRSHYYKFDMDSFLSRHLKILLSLGEINDSNMVEEIISNHPNVSSIILYGSVARGDDDEKSDIDILVVSRKETEIRGLKAEKKLSRELTIISYTLNEWRKKFKDDKVFYDRIIIEGIPLYGEMPMVS